MARSRTDLTGKKLEIMQVIEASVAERGFPPSVRELCDAVGLSSTSTVHTHLKSLQEAGYLKRDMSKPRAIEMRFHTPSGSSAERRPYRHVPLVGDIAAGTDVIAQENVEELLPLPEDFTGDGPVFMLRVKGDSMVDLGILDGDYVVVRQTTAVREGDVIAAGIPGDEATVKTYRRKGGRIVLEPANERLQPMVFESGEVSIYGKVTTVLRRL